MVLYWPWRVLKNVEMYKNFRYTIRKSCWLRLQRFHFLHILFMLKLKYYQKKHLPLFSSIMRGIVRLIWTGVSFGWVWMNEASLLVYYLRLTVTQKRPFVRIPTIKDDWLNVKSSFTCDYLLIFISTIYSFNQYLFLKWEWQRGLLHSIHLGCL